MANDDVRKATDDMAAIAPEFAKLTQDVLFGDIWKRPSKTGLRRKNLLPRSRILRSTRGGRPQHRGSAT
jgi:alkylhydroperoxidase/carboxymuconolactone decarboxylase family protein YurZ